MRGNEIEGNLKKGEKVVVVEDLISTAGSSLDVVKTLKEAGAEVLGIVSIFTYGLKKGLEKLEVVRSALLRMNMLMNLLKKSVRNMRKKRGLSLIFM